MPPNIVVFLADDLGIANVGFVRSNSSAAKLLQTPTYDKWRKESRVYTNAYSGPVCAPSRCTLFTGRNIGNCTVRGNDGAFTPLRAEESKDNIPGVLKKAGYTSLLAGKWGLGDEYTTGSPFNQSWDVFYGYDSQVAAHDWYPSKLFNATGPVTIEANENSCEQVSES